MIYKNGFKEYAMTTLVFGGFMGIFFGIVHGVIEGIIGGVISGILFTLFIFIFVKLMESKFKKMRDDIAKTKEIICDGGATVDGNGGWMFFTETGLEFYPHKINLDTNQQIIPISDIVAVNTKFNKIIVSTARGEQVNIVVSNSNGWKSHIDRHIKYRNIQARDNEDI